MKISKVILSNIGAYFGHYEIDLSINDPKKNVILFGGENGAGKTTLLDSIRIALFGPLLDKSKKEGINYTKRINSLLNKKALKNNEKNYRIILEFSMVENYVHSSYTLRRNWVLENSKIKENYEVIKDGQYLNEKDKEIFQTKLREESPPNLFELCLFDGEEISRIITDNKLSDYVMHSARVLFNLDIFENLEQDLSAYMKYTVAQGNKSELEEQLIDLEEKLNSHEDNLDILLNENIKITNSIKNNQQQVESLKKEFEINGGLLKEERDQYITQVNEIEQQRKLNTDQIRSFINGLLPIYLVREQLESVQNQMHSEQENESYEYIKNSFEAERLTPLVNSLKDLGVPVENEGDNLKNLLLEGFLSSIKPSGIELIHRASFNQRSEIEALVLQLKKLNATEYLDLLTENNNLLKQGQIIRKKIEENDKTHDFRDLFSSIQELNQQIEKEKLQLDKLEVDLVEVHKVIDEIRMSMNRLKSKIMDSSKSETTLSLSVKIAEVSKKFRMLQLQKKLQQVELEATKMINQLLRKEGFLHRITIDPTTFEVTLLAPQHEEIDQNTISAGEKELLLLSIIWAMFKTSGRRMPFVFDTLLGRLDKTHKERLLTKLIPICGEQVIILSTDSEIDNNHFSMIKPFLEKTYTLDYDKAHRKVNLQKDKYFNFNLTEMELSR